MPYMPPVIHLWCNTCQPLDSQYGSQSLPHMHVSAEVGCQIALGKEIFDLIHIYHPPIELWEGNVFSRSWVSVSVCAWGGPHVTTICDPLDLLEVTWSGKHYISSNWWT